MEVKWDFDVNKRERCVVCHENKAGVRMTIGYTDGDFVCKDCIDEYMRKVKEKLFNKVGENGELYALIDKRSDMIEHIQEMAKADWVQRTDVFDKLAEVYDTLFPRGITSGSPEVVGKYDNQDVKVGGSGIGRVRSSWSRTASYGSLDEQVRIAGKLWRSIYPLLSNYQDRTEKFKRMFSAFEEAIEDSDLKPYDTSGTDRVRCVTKIGETVEWEGFKDDTLVVEKSNRTYSDATVALASNQSEYIPLSVPKQNPDQWIELVPYMERALENARKQNEEREQELNEVIQKVESAVAPWYSANSISI